MLSLMYCHQRLLVTAVGGKAAYADNMQQQSKVKSMRMRSVVLLMLLCMLT